MHQYTPNDVFSTTVPILDDSDLILPAAGTLDTPLATLSDRTQWLHGRTGAKRITGLYGNAIGAVGYGTRWSETNPLTAIDPSFAELTGTEGLVLFGSPVALGAGDVLLVRCDVTVNPELFVGTLNPVGIALGVSVNGGGYSILTMSARYIPPISTSTVSLSAIVSLGVVSSFNFNLMGSITGGGSTTSVQLALRGIGSISVLHLSGN